MFAGRELATQLLLRACVYRLVTAGIAAPSDDLRVREEVDAYDRVARLWLGGTTERLFL